MSKLSCVFNRASTLSQLILRRYDVPLYNRIASCVNHRQIFTSREVIHRRKNGTLVSALREEAPPCVHGVTMRYSSAPLPPLAGDQSELSDIEYENICEETLDGLAEKFEDIAEMGITTDQFDVAFASGVITVQLGEDKGTFVINKQAPNKQIWLSSPYSGPKRYDFNNGTWIYKHEGRSLHSLLTEELSKEYSRDIDFTDCSHGKPKS